MTKHKLFARALYAVMALALVAGLTLVPATPVSATHTSTATVAFTDEKSTMQGEASSLDVEVTNSAGSLGNINEVVIDFSGTAFTGIGAGTATGWTGVEDTGVITYTPNTEGDQIAPGASLKFVPVVTNPPTIGVATNPVVTTSDTGSKAELEATEDTGWIGYIADATGTAGNDITIAYANAAPYSELIVNVVGSAISVELADDATGLTSTATLVAEAINLVESASAELVTATVKSGYGDDPVPVMSATALSGGSLAMVDKPCPVTGILEVTELLLVVTVTPTAATSASLTSYVIGFTTIGAIANDEAITITFPAEYDITGVLPADVSVTDYIGGEVITKVGQVVTITADGTNPIAAADEAVEVTIADHVKNPPASGDYDIAVATTIGDHGLGEVTIIPASFGVVAGTDDTVTAGTAFAVTITALNAEDPAETDIGYTGDHFIDFAWVESPEGTPTLLVFDLITFTAGIGTSDQYFVLTDVQSGIKIKADATELTITGTSDEITINPATFVAFSIAGKPTSVVAGVAFTTTANDIIVTALDADDNVVEGYTGTVSWTSTDGQAVLPAAHTFTTGDGEDNGEHTFLGSLFTLKTVGTVDQTITVTDVAAEVSKESAAITVTPAAAESMVVVASPDVIEADNSDIATITATALDEFGNVDTNYTGDKGITIASSLGTIAAANPSFTLGEATTTLTSDDKVGTATIRVTSDFDLATTTVKLLADIGIESITVTVDKASILNDGVDVRTITATYLDSDSETVTAAEGADYAFTFSVNDVDTVLSTTDPVNPVAGVATVTLTTTAASGTVIAVTADGTGAGDGSENITVTEGTYLISLATGWNLISLPLYIPSANRAPATLLASVLTNVLSVWGDYDPASGNWSSYDPSAPLTDFEMRDGKGYWINMSAADTLDISALGSELPAPPAAPPTYDVVSGWNLIGFKSTTSKIASDYLAAIDGKYTVIYGYNAATVLYTTVKSSDNLQPSYGYWIAMTESGAIYP